eukprot:NODE_826_length_3671_cov_0.402296.p3 type:complete len:106 gc:universal NODE_826_length_3671_cov_0.402296:3196-3513(+)
MYKVETQLVSFLTRIQRKFFTTTNPIVTTFASHFQVASTTSTNLTLSIAMVHFEAQMGTFQLTISIMIRFLASMTCLIIIATKTPWKFQRNKKPKSDGFSIYSNK